MTRLEVRHSDPTLFDPRDPLYEEWLDFLYSNAEMRIDGYEATHRYIQVIRETALEVGRKKRIKIKDRNLYEVHRSLLRGLKIPNSIVDGFEGPPDAIFPTVPEQVAQQWLEGHPESGPAHAVERLGTYAPYKAHLELVTEVFDEFRTLKASMDRELNPSVSIWERIVDRRPEVGRGPGNRGSSP